MQAMLAGRMTSGGGSSVLVTAILVVVATSHTLAVTLNRANCDNRISAELCALLLQWQPDTIVETFVPYRSAPVLPTGEACDWPDVKFSLEVSDNRSMFLVIDSNTGAISGKFVSEGEYKMRVTAYRLGNEFSLTAQVTVPPKLTLAGRTIHAAVGHPVKDDEDDWEFVNDDVVRYGLAEDSLSQFNLHLNESTGGVAGIPTKEGKVSVLSYAFGTTGARLLLPLKKLKIVPAPRIEGWTPRTVLPRAFLNTEYHLAPPGPLTFFNFNLTERSKATFSPTWSYSKKKRGGMPRGLDVDRDTGAIRGKPRETGTFSFRMYVAQADTKATIELEEVELTVLAPPESSSDSTKTTILAVSLSILGAAIIGLLYCCWHASGHVLLHLPENATLKKMAISRHRLRLSNQIGKGQFGTVHLGVLAMGKHGMRQVAIKQCTSSSGNSRSEFIAEARLLSSFSQPQPHPNIVELVGVCVSSSHCMMVMEYMSLGDLKSLLLESRPTPQYINNAGVLVPAVPAALDLDQLVELAEGIARGMIALTEANPPVIHRDLAARNCLVTKQEGRLVAKISDFGLSRNLVEQYYIADSEAQLPVRWMAPESVADCKFTQQSDVYSFGIVMYELITFGAMPYPGLSNAQVIDFLQSGSHMDQPSDSPEEWNDLMLQCWATVPSKRPSFQSCKAALSLMRLAGVQMPNTPIGTSAPDSGLGSVCSSSKAPGFAQKYVGINIPQTTEKRSRSLPDLMRSGTSTLKQFIRLHENPVLALPGAKLLSDTLHKANGHHYLKVRHPSVDEPNSPVTPIYSPLDMSHPQTAITSLMELTTPTDVLEPSQMFSPVAPADPPQHQRLHMDLSVTAITEL
eukprot:m.43895 g.43895  ORF g.43895 m.43895 type:complete len:854 (-) comp11666_c0_seq1:250-2811(-)